MIVLIIALILMQWIILPFVNNEWQLTLLTQYITIASLFTYILKLLHNEKLLRRSLFALLALDAWCDVIKFALWQFSDYEIDLSIIGVLLFFIWFVFVLKRKYPERLDLVDLNNVNILILKPRSSLEVLKGLIGYPAASICIVSNGYIWCFRRNSGAFEKTEYHHGWVDSHLVIDTKVKCNDSVLLNLESLLGKKRFPCIKCVWTIRGVLNLLGSKYVIKSWFDYVPGLYFMRIM